MNKWIWLAVAGGIVVLGAGSFVVYGSDENRLARLCTERSSVPQMKVVEPPSFSWRFGNQAKVAPDTPALASLDAYVAQNRQLWAEIRQVQDDMMRQIGGAAPERSVRQLTLRAELNEVNGQLITTLAKLDASLGTASRLHVSQDSFVVRDQAPLDIDTSFRLSAANPGERLMFPTVETSMEVTCYSTINTDGEPLAAVFPTSWTTRRLICAVGDVCKDWDEFIATIPPDKLKAGQPAT